MALRSNDELVHRTRTGLIVLTARFARHQLVRVQRGLRACLTILEFLSPSVVRLAYRQALASYRRRWTLKERWGLGVFHILCDGMSGMGEAFGGRHQMSRLLAGAIAAIQHRHCAAEYPNAAELSRSAGPNGARAASRSSPHLTRTAVG